MLKLTKLSIFTTLFFCFSIFTFAQNKTAEDFFNEGFRHFKAGKYQEALTALRESAKLDPKQPSTFANMGLVLISLDRRTEAVEAFQQAVKLAPENSDFRAGLCRAFAYNQKMTQAIAECNEAIRLAPDSLMASTNLILVYQMQKRPPQEILVLIEKALQKSSDDENLLQVAASTYAEIGDNERAAAAYEKLATRFPQAVIYQILLADIYLRLERDSDAIAAANKALELDADSFRARYFLGKVYFELGQNEDAANALQLAAASNAAMPEVFYYLGTSLSRIGKQSEAVTALKKAVELEPGEFLYQKELGAQLNSASRYEEAIVPLRKAVELNQKDFESKVGLGLALFESAKYEESLQILAEADRMKPGEPTVNMFLNVARARQQNVGQIEQMRAFAAENPNDLNVRLHLVQLLTYTRQLKEAEPYFEEIWKMNPSDVRVYEMIATLHATTGDGEKAFKAYQKAIEMSQSPTGYLGLANYYARKGQIAEAIKSYDKLFEIKPDSPNVMKLYADLLRDNGKKREALAMYKRSLEMLPTNAPVLFNAGILSAKTGDREAAQIYFERLKSVDAKLAKTLGRFLRLRNQ